MLAKVYRHTTSFTVYYWPAAALNFINETEYPPNSPNHNFI